MTKLMTKFQFCVNYSFNNVYANFLIKLLTNGSLNGFYTNLKKG